MRGGEGRFDYKREGNVVTEAEIAVMWQRAKECQGMLAATGSGSEKRERVGSPLELLGGASLLTPLPQKTRFRLLLSRAAKEHISVVLSH